MRVGTRAIAGAMLAAAVAAAPAQAQAGNVSYTTSGTFSGPSSGFSITYDPFTGTNLVPNVPGNTINLGNFFVSGSGSATPVTQIFTLSIAQTAPTIGTGSTMGSITGTVQSVGGNYSTLVFAPTNQAITIGGTTYTLIYDQGVNGIKLAYNGVDVKNTTALKASLTQTAAVPEPASIVLLGTGLVGVFGAARRRRAVTR